MSKIKVRQTPSQRPRNWSLGSDQTELGSVGQLTIQKSEKPYRMVGGLELPTCPVAFARF